VQAGYLLNGSYLSPAVPVQGSLFPFRVMFIHLYLFIYLIETESTFITIDYMQMTQLTRRHHIMARAETVDPSNTENLKNKINVCFS
jgi:hypothetical protein